MKLGQFREHASKVGSRLGRAIHEPMPVSGSGEAFDEFSGALAIQILHESKAPRFWSTRISPEIHMDQWLPNLSEVIDFFACSVVSLDDGF